MRTHLTTKAQVYTSPSSTDLYATLIEIQQSIAAMEGWGVLADTATAAIINAALESGLPVRLPRGIFLIDRPLVVRNTELWGSGHGTIIRGTTANTELIRISDADHALVGHLQLDRQGDAAVGGDNIIIENSRLVDLKRLRIMNGHHGWRIAHTTSPKPVLEVIGSAGAQTLGYLIQTRVDGVPYEVVAPTVITNGPTTLNGTDKVRITFEDPAIPAKAWTATGSSTRTIVHDIYRTMGGGSQGYIGTIASGVETFDDTGIAATGEVPGLAEYSPFTIAVRQGTAGTTVRRYAICQVRDGVRSGLLWPVKKTDGFATLDGSHSYDVYFIGEPTEEFEDEYFEVWALERPEGVGLLGTLEHSAEPFSDTGGAPIASMFTTPAQTRSGQVNTERCWVEHENATGTNASWGVEWDSCDECTMDKSHVRGYWLDGGKLRAEVRDFTWRGGSSNYNGKGVNHGTSGDGLDMFAGGNHVLLDGVQMSWNGGNGCVAKTVGWSSTLRVGNPEYGLVREQVIVNCHFVGNLGSGVQLEGVEDGVLVTGEDIRRPRVAHVTVANCHMTKNLLYGVQCNSYMTDISGCVVRSNYRDGISVDLQARDITIDRCRILGNGTERYTAPGTYAGIKILGESSKVAKLTGTVSAGATSFVIDRTTWTDGDGHVLPLPYSGRIAIARVVAGVPYTSRETFHYTRSGTTITLIATPGVLISGLPDNTVRFTHQSANGTGWDDVTFLEGAQGVTISNCRINGKQHPERGVRSEIALSGDLEALDITHRNSIEVFEGADDIRVLDCSTRFVTSDPYEAPVIIYTAADLISSARVWIRHAGNQATPTNRMWGSPGSMYFNYYGTGGQNVSVYIKETGDPLQLSDTSGWVQLGSISPITTQGTFNTQGHIVQSPEALQTINAATDTLTFAGSLLQLNPAANYTLTSAPTLPDPQTADGATTGRRCTIFGWGATFITTVQDQVASGIATNLRLRAATRAIGPGSVLELIYMNGDWWEVSFSG